MGRRIKKKGRLMRLIIAIVLIFLLISYAIYAENNKLEVSFYYTETTEIPNTIRIVQLSDLHKHEFGQDNCNLVQKVKDLEPDMIAITGDMNVGSDADYDIVITLCKQLVDIAPCYYSLGNHEYSQVLFNHSNLINDLTDIGVNVLNDEVKDITINGDDITICGLSQGDDQYRKFGTEVIAKLEESSRYKILLDHYPKLFETDLTDTNIDLALCGHAHGGHIRIPIIGGLYSPDQGFLPKLSEGEHNIGDTMVIISRGLGNNSIIPRINNDPEICVIDIISPGHV